MKERAKGLVAGILIAATVFGTAGTALAATGALTLNVIPVNIKVNNKVFKPKDVNGKDVMVFAYNGTTYAPLRALAEAYGLEVGWDQASGTATVSTPITSTTDYDWTDADEVAYKEFASKWEIKKAGERIDENGIVIGYTMTYIPQNIDDDPQEYLDSLTVEQINNFSIRMRKQDYHNEVRMRTDVWINETWAYYIEIFQFGNQIATISSYSK